MQLSRRDFLESMAVLTASSAIPINTLFASQGPSASRHPFGDGQLTLLGDGHLMLPRSFLFPESIDQKELNRLLEMQGIAGDSVKPDCNITLWEHDDRRVLFDVGAGTQFMESAGELVDSLNEANIDPVDITDVVLTHAHPDHLWGLIDDFDDLQFPEANYYMHQAEWEYWMASDTLEKTPDSQKAFVAGAQNRLPRIEDRVNLFQWGDEILPGVEAVDSHGHTPGHTSFAVHSNNETAMVLGDALTQSVISFAKPDWPSGSDQDPEQGRATRVKLLDRLASEKSRIVGFHLPHPGLGRVERYDNHYRYSSA